MIIGNSSSLLGYVMICMGSLEVLANGCIPSLSIDRCVQSFTALSESFASPLGEISLNRPIKSLHGVPSVTVFPVSMLLITARVILI